MMMTADRIFVWCDTKFSGSCVTLSIWPALTLALLNCCCSLDDSSSQLI